MMNEKTRRYIYNATDRYVRSVLEGDNTEGLEVFIQSMFKKFEHENSGLIGSMIIKEFELASQFHVARKAEENAARKAQENAARKAEENAATKARLQFCTGFSFPQRTRLQWKRKEPTSSSSSESESESESEIDDASRSEGESDDEEDSSFGSLCSSSIEETSESYEEEPPVHPEKKIRLE